MKSVLSLIALAALFGTCCCFQSECNATLPWNVSIEDHPAIPPERLEELLRCPEELHGCSALRVNCTDDLFAVTCSCAENCERYGDCCWDAGTSLSSKTASKCISRNVEKFSRREFYVVSGCDLNWPDDEVRSSCENATELKDPFYLIPVTTEKLTYFNAFCALCNYDLDSRSMFWNASGSAGRDFQVAPPQYALENSDLFFWPCDDGLVEVTTCPEGTDSDIKRKCLTYFAPVRSETNETEVVYKNVYCGLCNDAELSSMKCLPKQVVREIWPRIQFRAGFRPNLLSLIRPVVSQDSCFSWHAGKCYIKAPQYHYANTSMPTAENETIGNNMTNVTSPEHEPYNVQNYLTVICISLSLICLFLKGLVYMLNKSSRTFSSRCTLCLSATLFCSHLLFLLGNSFDVSKPVCVVFAAVLHYGFLSTFFWTSVLSFDIWKNVAAVRLSSSRHGGFLLYALVAWGGPVVVVAVCLVLDWTAPHFVLSPQYGRFACWIGSLWSQLAFFLMPMVILLVLDIGLYIHIVMKIRDTAKRAAAFDFKGGSNKSHMALFVKLAFIMGTTWLLGFVGAFVNALALDIIVIVLIGLQGVYLFFGFKDYEHLLPKRFRRKRRAVATGVSTTHTELSSSGKDFSSREDISRSPAARSSEKHN